MNFEAVGTILRTLTGDLPDINFDFGEHRLVAAAYALIQARASAVNADASYWSNSTESDCLIRLGDNPAQHYLDGDTAGFHVVFSGLQTTAGAAIPDLGVSVYGPCFIGLDYRAGPGWTEPAIIGLFELMQALSRLSDDVTISHANNIHDDGDSLMTAYHTWTALP
jgi:hypothetical protein